MSHTHPPGGPAPDAPTPVSAILPLVVGSVALLAPARTVVALVRAA